MYKKGQSFFYQTNKKFNLPPPRPWPWPWPPPVIDNTYKTGGLFLHFLFTAIHFLKSLSSHLIESANANPHGSITTTSMVIQAFRCRLYLIQEILISIWVGPQCVCKVVWVIGIANHIKQNSGYAIESWRLVSFPSHQMVWFLHSLYVLHVHHLIT